MTKHQIPFSLDIRVGDSTLQEAVSGAIEVNLYDDPQDDEINAWRIHQRHPVFEDKVADQVERLAIEEARKQLAKDRGEQQVDQAS